MNYHIIPDMKHSALIIIDVQRDFTVHGVTGEIPGTFHAVPYMKSLVKEYRGLGYPILHVVRLYSVDGSNVDLCRRQAIENGKQIVISGSDGAELMDELKTLLRSQIRFKPAAFR
ncbi:MAG: isochorismatase family protein [Nitrososphaeraceae archaeon]